MSFLASEKHQVPLEYAGVAIQFTPFTFNLDLILSFHLFCVGVPLRSCIIGMVNGTGGFNGNVLDVSFTEDTFTQ